MSENATETPVAQNSNETATAKRIIGRPFQPGQSGNPGGRKKGFARRILELTDDGEELIQHALAVLRDENAGYRARAEARQWLTNYAIGKPVETQDMNVNAVIQEYLKELVPFLDPTKEEELARWLSNIEARGRS